MVRWRAVCRWSDEVRTEECKPDKGQPSLMFVASAKWSVLTLSVQRRFVALRRGNFSPVSNRA